MFTGYQVCVDTCVLSWMDTTLSTISCGSILEMLPLPLHCWIPGVLYIIDCRNKKPAVNCVKISHHHHHQLHRTPSSETSSEMLSAVAYQSQLSLPETKHQCFRKLMCECGKIPGKSSKPSGIAHRVLQNHTPPWHRCDWSIRNDQKEEGRRKISPSISKLLQDF